MEHLDLETRVLGLEIVVRMLAGGTSPNEELAFAQPDPDAEPSEIEQYDRARDYARSLLGRGSPIAP